MKNVIFPAILGLAALALVGSPSTLTPACQDGVSDNGNCAPGQVLFTGTGFPATVHVRVTRRSNDAQYDDFDYDAAGGVLTFTETLHPADRYTISLSGSGFSASQSITTGAPAFINND